MNAMFAPRQLAKDAVTVIIHGSVAQLSKDALNDHTDLDEDSKTVNVVSYVVGWGVSYKLSPLTDRMVDKTVDFIAAKRAARTAKKNTEEK